MVPDLFGHSADYAYNQLYATASGWQGVQVKGTPGEADLILEIRFSVETSAGQVIKGDTVGSGYDPQLELKLIDPATKVTLWVFRQHVPVARLQSNREKDSRNAVAGIIESARKLMSKGAPPPTGGASK